MLSATLDVAATYVKQREEQYARSSQLAGRLGEMAERWMQLAPGAPVECIPRDDLVPTLQELLQQLVPSNHYGECARMRSATVTKIDQILSTDRWIQYKAKRDQIAHSLQGRPECPSASDLAPALKQIEDAMRWVTLNAS